MLTTGDKPTVLIVGAGLGGLMLGALLEKSGVPYQIFERAAAVKPLGIYDELVSIGKYFTQIMGYKESLELMRPLDFKSIEEFTGYEQYIVDRPKLYDLMLKQVPAHKIHFGHRVLNITEENDRVTIHLSNNDTIEGDVIVGADGAYSAVRQRMYEQLRVEGKLPKTDQEELPFSCTCLVGQTGVLDPKEFPVIDLPQCHFTTVHGADKPFTTSKAAMEQRFRNNENSEWGAYPAQTMCEETRNFPIELLDGKKRTLGDLYDLTPKEFISKVMLEEKVFTTWYHKRYVLMGDACHKLSPAGGHGAVTAMHDAIALANLFYAMPAKTSEDITKIFEEYYKERLPAVTESYNNSRQLAKISEKGFVGSFILYLSTHMPIWLWRLGLAKTVRHRPQVGFLPAIGVKGSVTPVVSVSEQLARAVFEKQQQQQASSI
ncbi:hypothetical protein BG015_008403 [Linnemannia schmuckeri]|uniref:FAD-binding domain-containing protein n=1 Tax=Linnemannia schmuckeri TaxID=64567 RepID=A0A9P5S603_9FUNG|nr:hypothetical protein BG015_008403 [Linnemannia schmuckeri]